MKFHLGSSLGAGSISCTCSFPFDIVPLLPACSCDGVNIMLKTLKHIENLLRTLPTSLPTCTHIFCSSALSSWWFASHQSKRGENGKSLSPILSLKLRFFFCYFFFRISVDFWSNKQNTFVQQIGLSYKKNHIMTLTKYFLEKGNTFLLERKSAVLLLIIWWKECSYQLPMRPFIDFFHSREHEILDFARKTGSEVLCVVESS